CHFNDLLGRKQVQEFWSSEDRLAFISSTRYSHNFWNNDTILLVSMVVVIYKHKCIIVDYVYRPC
ncbi:hypothetical protein S83_060222, partial [Arachis hypogaea]